MHSRRRPAARGAGVDRVPRADPARSWPPTASRPRSGCRYGATEAKIPEIADAVVEITETGRALRAAGLRIVDTILVSYTELIANPTAYADADQAPRHGAAADPAASARSRPGAGCWSS